MNITETLKDILTGFNEIDSVNIDYTINSVSNFGLYSTGENITREFVTGKKEYMNNCVLYMFKESETDEQRMQNISLLNSISEQLRNIRNYTLIEDEEAVGYIDSISCGNGMLFAVPGSIYEGYSYQLQIQVTYILFAPPLNAEPPAPPPPPEPDHQLTVATYDNGVFTLNGWCKLTYINSLGQIIRKDTFTGGINTSIVPEGAVNMDIIINPATEDCDFCGYIVSPSDGKIRIFYGLNQ